MIHLLVLFGIDAIVFSKMFLVKHSPQRHGIKGAGEGGGLCSIWEGLRNLTNNNPI